MLGIVEFVWLKDGVGNVVFKETTVWLSTGVGAVVLANPEGLGAAVVTLEVGAAVVPLIENGDPTVALELIGVDVGSTAREVELTGMGKNGVEVGNNVPLVETVILAVGMARPELLAGTDVGVVMLVGMGVSGTVRLFEGTTTLVVEAFVFVGSGSTKVVEFRGRTTLVEGTAGDDELPVGMGDVAVPLEVVFDVGNGAVAVVESGTGPSMVVEFNGMAMVVETAEPFTVTLDTMAVTEGEGADGGDVVFEMGKGARRVVELTGIETLVAAAEPLTLTVDGLAVIVELADGGRSVGSGEEGVGASIVVTTGFEVLLRDSGDTRATSEHPEDWAGLLKLTRRVNGDCVHGSYC